MAVIDIPEWLPDLADHGNPGLVTCQNAISRTPTSYGPFASLGSAYGSTLTGRAQGAFTGADSSGNPNIFAGDATKLYRLTSASTSWEDVSQTATTYALGAEEAWRFVQFGNRVIAAGGLSNAIQSYVVGTSSDFGVLSSSSYVPKAHHVAVVRDFVMFGNVNDPTDGNVPHRVHWPAINDPTDWPAPGGSSAVGVQSDYQDLPDAGAVMGIVGGLAQADAVIVQEGALTRAMYRGTPEIFIFDKIEGGRGCIAAGSIIQSGGIFSYLADNGFYLFDGAQSVPIGANKVDKTFFADLDQSYYTRISSAVDPINKIFYWSYAGAGNSSGTPNRIISYNWVTQRWTLIEAEAELIFRAGTFGYNVDNADSLYNVDTSPFGPDSRFWSGGSSVLAGFTTAHRLAFFSGSNLAARFETGDLDTEGLVMVTGVRPIVDGGTVTTQVGYREDQADAVGYTTATSPGADKFCFHKIRTRFPRMRMDIAAGGEWNHAKGFVPRFKPAGKKL
jgi:hypothetical protein